ncbi:MAG TPA: hypothetical protein VMX55_09935 [candidate division Zixibacteria bacterium]|nr:hypothetical protein [candidate division Zixibacteria bacterium]
MQFYEDDEYDTYHDMDINVVLNQIEELEHYAKLQFPIEEKITHYQTILLNKRFAMDYRYEAMNQLSKLVDNFPNLAVPVLLNFLESGESEFNDPNYQLSKAWCVIDPCDYVNIYSDENWFEDILDLAISSLNSSFPETKEAIHVLVDIVKNKYYCNYVDSAVQVLCELGERYQDMRYIIVANLYEERKLNPKARLLLDYLEEFYNQLDYFKRDFFSEWFFSEIYVEEQYNF